MHILPRISDVTLGDSWTPSCLSSQFVQQIKPSTYPMGRLWGVNEFMGFKRLEEGQHRLSNLEKLAVIF